MRHLANQLSHRITQKAGIGVQRDDELHPLWHLGSGQKTGVGRTAQQAVQLHQFAALAFPSHPDPFRRVPAALALQQQKSGATLRRIARVQCGNRRPRRAGQSSVNRCGFLVTVHAIRQQRVMHLAAHS